VERVSPEPGRRGRLAEMKTNQERGDLASEDEIQMRAIRRVNERMRWKPSHPIEEEIYQIAIQRVDHLLRDKKEGE